MSPGIPIHDLPAGRIIASGLTDIHEGRISIGSLLVRICWSRLVQSGVIVAGTPKPAPLSGDCHHRLYALLCGEKERDAYPEYRALLRQLASFLHAADQRAFRIRQTSPAA